MIPDTENVLGILYTASSFVVLGVIAYPYCALILWVALGVFLVAAAIAITSLAVKMLRKVFD